MRNEKDCRSDNVEILFRSFLFRGPWLTVPLLVLSLLGMRGSVLVKASEKEVIFEKVEEKAYEEYTRGIAFDLASEDGKDRMYCKMIWLDGKELQFLNETGEIISVESLAVTNEPNEVGRFTGREAVFSRDGNFAAIDEYVSVWGDAGPYPVEEHYTIFDEKGHELYTVEGILEGRDSRGRFLISDRDGSAVGTRLTYGALDFYSPEGPVKTVPLFGELGWWRGGEGYAAFSQDGEYLAVLIQYMGKRPHLHSYGADEVWFMLFDRNGNELWRKNVGERKIDMIAPEKLAISWHGEYILVKGQTIQRGRGKGQRELTSLTFTLYDKTGKELSFTDTSLGVFRYFAFSRQEDCLVLGGDNIVWVLRTGDGSTVFQKELPGDGWIRQVCFSGDGRYVIAHTKTRVTTGYTYRVFALDFNGDCVWEHDFPKVKRISTQGGYVGLASTRGYQIYKIAEK